MSTPRETRQWNVLVHGVGKVSAQFQRMMEWVLRDIPNAHSLSRRRLCRVGWRDRGGIHQKSQEAHPKWFQNLEEIQLVARPAKLAFFQSEVLFLGHVIRMVVREPSTENCCHFRGGKAHGPVLSYEGFCIQRTHSRNTSMISRSLPHREKLPLVRENGEKKSKKAVFWNRKGRPRLDVSTDSSIGLLKSSFIFNHISDPYIFWCDAGDFFIGAVLAQKIDGTEQTRGFHPRKVASSKMSLAVEEKGMYAVVAALLMRSDVNNFQPGLVTTFSRALEHKVAEHVDIPREPSGLKFIHSIAWR